jgi:hypothetical protein
MAPRTRRQKQVSNLPRKKGRYCDQEIQQITAELSPVTITKLTGTPDEETREIIQTATGTPDEESREIIQTATGTPDEETSIQMEELQCVTKKLSQKSIAQILIQNVQFASYFRSVTHKMIMRVVIIT